MRVSLTSPQVLPYFIMSLGLEAVVRVLQGKPAPRINDSVNSLTAGMLMLFMDFFTGSFAVVGYSLLYQYFHLVDFDWDSPWTWWIAFFGVDLAYYWFHRMAHGTLLCIRYARLKAVLITHYLP